MAAAVMSPPTLLGDHEKAPVGHDAHATTPTGPSDPAQITAPSAALTPPTSEDNDLKNEMASSSDLSELNEVKIEEDGPDQEEEEEEEITPDHYYDGGKIPVFKPTMDQFRSFKKYVEKIDRYGMQAGIVKVIPPPEWRESLPKLDELVKRIRIKNPIMQEFMGTHGTYTQANIEKQRSYNLPEWKALTDEPQNQPPARRGERRRGQTQVQRGGANVKGKSQALSKPKPVASSTANGRRRGRARKGGLPTPTPSEGNAAIERSSTPDPASDEIQVSVEIPERPPPPAAKKKQTRSRGTKGDTKKSVSSRRMNNQSEKVDFIDEAAFEGFDFRMDGLDEFTPERCKELETAYWKSLTFAQPMYAADMPGSLFTDDVTSWNVAKLENLLDVLGTKVPGVNTAYLYMGMWKATFAWHLEDVDLYSINYIHFGAPKQWYSISQVDARRFEAAMKSVWPNDSKNCDQFLRHKTYLISPQLLKDKFNIEVNRLVHHEGEFVITYPYGYHSGYNLGYNCAESVNFALESWLDFGRIARKCECEADSVWVDTAEIERKLRGEPTPEYYEETDDDDDEDMEDAGDLPTPPASVKGKDSRKRKRDAKDKGDKDKQKKKRKIRIRIKTANREPCVLCPNDPRYEPILPTDNGKQAHRSCALYTPETFLSIVDGREMVMNVANIDKARLELKCNFCRSKRGACFQCASKKCTRAFHATCALAAGVQIDMGPVPTFGEDGTEYWEEGFDLRCKFHRPRRPKNIDLETLENSKLINNYAKRLQANDVVQVQYIGGDAWGGLVVENRPEELAVLVDVLPEGDRVEVEWKYLLVLNPDDSLRPQPSSAAIPMPADMNKKLVSIDNRQDGVPKIDEVFQDNEANKWAEFSNLADPPQGYRPGAIRNQDQSKVDLSKPNQLYFYLGSISTEARSKFTDDVAKKEPVDSADFMERVRLPAASRRVQSNPAPPKTQHAANVAPLAPSMSGPATAPRPSSNRAGGNRIRLAPAPRPINTNVRQLSMGSTYSSQPESPFPPDAYYSSTILPAAFVGQYSTYKKHVRETSRDDTIGRRPSLSGRYAHLSPKLPPLPTLQPAPDFTTRKPARPSNGSDPSRSLAGSGTVAGRDNNVEWTPPSQIFHSHGLDRTDRLDRSAFPTLYGGTQFPAPSWMNNPGSRPGSSRERPSAVHSSTADFQRQMQEQQARSSVMMQGQGEKWAGEIKSELESGTLYGLGEWGVWNGVNGLPDDVVDYIPAGAASGRTFKGEREGQTSPQQPTPSPLSVKEETKDRRVD